MMVKYLCGCIGTDGDDDHPGYVYVACDLHRPDESKYCVMEVDPDRGKGWTSIPDDELTDLLCTLADLAQDGERFRTLRRLIRGLM